MATRAIADPSSLAPEHISVLQLARTPTTVADIASDVDLPLGVFRILLADLRELCLVAIHTPVAVGAVFGVGMTTLVDAVSDIRLLRTEEPLTEGRLRTDSPQGVEGKTTTTVA